MEKFNQAEFNKVINRTLSGLQMFVRDVNQPKEIADKYKAGMLIHDWVTLTLVTELAGWLPATVLRSSQTIWPTWPPLSKEPTGASALPKEEHISSY